MGLQISFEKLSTNTKEFIQIDGKISIDEYLGEIIEPTKLEKQAQNEREQNICHKATINNKKHLQQEISINKHQNQTQRP